MINSSTKKFTGSEVSLLFKLAFPMACVGFLESSVGFFSNIFLAHLGANELAAGAIVQWLFFALMVIVWGLLTSVSVLVAHKYGEKNYRDISLILRDSILLGIIFVIPTMLILRNISPIFILAGQKQSIATLAQTYLTALSWGIPGDFLGLILMQFIIGLGQARTNLVFTLMWVPVNILCNYILIFGKFGIPAFGIAGIGWGTSISYFLIAVIITVYILVHKSYRQYLEGFFVWSKPKFLGELIHMGLPMGLMYSLEIGFFLTLSLLMGHLGIAEIAGNQITMQYIGQVSVVSFAIAQAVTVRMGHTIGSKQLYLAERSVYIGLLIAVSVVMTIALFYNLFPLTIIGVDLDVDAPKNAEIVAFAIQFLSVASLFMIIESLRLTLFGALRGLKDTRFTLLTSILSFWGISLPVGYLFAMVMHNGGIGFWWGTIVGQTSALALLYYRFRYKMDLAYRLAAA